MLILLLTLYHIHLANLHYGRSHKVWHFHLHQKIRVNAIGLGPNTKSYRQTKKQFDQQIMRTPLKKQVKKLLEINNTIDLILNSDSITGQLFLLDSGQNLGWRQTQDQKFIED